MGMYSGAQKIQPEIKVIEIFINDKKLSAANYNATTWDQITLPLQVYCNQQKNGLQFYQDDISRLLGKFRIPSNESVYFTPISEEA
jgi:hypothetical protein